MNAMQPKRLFSIAALAVALAVAGGCADVNKYSVSRAESRWADSMEPAQKGKTVLDWERSISRKRTRAEGGSVFTDLDRRFSESTRDTNRRNSVSAAVKRISEDESHQKYLADNSVAGASRRLDHAQGR